MDWDEAIGGGVIRRDSGVVLKGRSYYVRTKNEFDYICLEAPEILTFSWASAFLLFGILWDLRLKTHIFW